MKIYILNFIVYTMAMIGVIYLSLMVFKRTIGQNSIKSCNNSIKIEESLNIGPRKTLHVVNVKGEKFLIASDIQTTTFLSKLGEENKNKSLQFKKDDEKTFLSELDELKNQENTKNIETNNIETQENNTESETSGTEQNAEITKINNGVEIKIESIGEKEPPAFAITKNEETGIIEELLLPNRAYFQFPASGSIGSRTIIQIGCLVFSIGTILLINILINRKLKIRNKNK